MVEIHWNIEHFYKVSPALTNVRLKKNCVSNTHSSRHTAHEVYMRPARMFGRCLEKLEQVVETNCLEFHTEVQMGDLHHGELTALTTEQPSCQKTHKQKQQEDKFKSIPVRVWKTYDR